MMKLRLAIAIPFAFLCLTQAYAAAPYEENPTGNGVEVSFERQFGFSPWLVTENSKRRQSKDELYNGDSWLSLRDRRILDETIDSFEVGIHKSERLTDADVAELVANRLQRTDKSCRKGGELVAWAPEDTEGVIASNMYVCQRDRYKGPEIFGNRVGVGVAVWAMRKGDSVFLFQYVGFRAAFSKDKRGRIGAQLASRANKLWPIDLLTLSERLAANDNQTGISTQ